MLGARSAVGGAGSTHAEKGQELTRGHIHSSTRVPGPVLGDAELSRTWACLVGEMDVTPDISGQGPGLGPD